MDQVNTDDRQPRLSFLPGVRCELQNSVTQRHFAWRESGSMVLGRTHPDSFGRLALFDCFERGGGARLGGKGHSAEGPPQATAPGGMGTKQQAKPPGLSEPAG